MILRIIKTFFTIVFVISSIYNIKMASAQAQEQFFLEITYVNTENFPDIEVFVAGGNSQIPLTSLDIQFVQNETTQMLPIQSVKKDVDLQVALVLAPDIVQPKNSLNPFPDSITGAIADFSTGNYLNIRQDGLAAYTLHPETKYLETIQPWVREGGYTLVTNGILQYKPTIPESEQPIPLTLQDLLMPIVDKFDTNREQFNIPNPESAAKSIVLFTGGTAINDQAQEIISLANRLAEQNIRVHIVAIEPLPVDNKLEQIASLTHGTYFNWPDHSDISLFWRQVISQRTQQAFTYRASNDNFGVLVAQTNLNGMDRIRSQPVSIPPVTLLPPHITIVVPPPNQKLKLDGLVSNLDTATSVSQPLAVQVQLAWPDGYERRLHEVEYRLYPPNSTEAIKDVRKSEPFLESAINLSQIEEGAYRLEVLAIDELGEKSEPAIGFFDVAINSNGISDNFSEGINSIPELQQRDTLLEANTEAAEETTSPTIDILSGIPISTLVWGAGISGLIILLIGIRHLKLSPLGKRNGNPIKFPSSITARHKHAAPRIDEGKENSADFDDPSFTPTALSTGMPSIEVSESATVLGTPLKPLASLIYEKGNQGEQSLPAKQDIIDGIKNVKIGRNPEWSNLIIADTRVSRKHAIIAVNEKQELRIQNKSQQAGTFVNGEKLSADGWKLLHHDDMISFGGEIIYRVEIHS